jgi:hypothetical protein
MQTTKPVPRFVPTLTEVVRPGLLAPPGPLIDSDALTKQVLEALKPRFEQQLRTALQAVVEEQLRQDSSCWQREVEIAVNAAVERALAQRLPPKN